MKTRKGWFLISLVIFILVIVLLAILEDTAEVEQKKRVQFLAPVSVVTSQPGSYKAVIQVNAEVRPRWATTLKSQTSGECLKITNKALVGQRVKKGDLLLQIENSAYQVSVRDAEQALTEAQLNLLQQQKKSAQAERDWQRAQVKKPASDLTLNKPQVELARKAVIAAKSRLNAAEKSMANTQVKAPFSGLITARYVSLGQAVLEGEELFHIVGLEKYELSAALDKAQWRLLEKDWKNQIATLHTVSSKGDSNKKIGSATIKRGGGYFDPKTRQRKLFLEVDGDSNPEVKSGDFIQLRLPGRQLENVLSLPESSLTRDGMVWYLDAEDRLRSFNAEVLFHRDDQIVIAAPKNNGSGSENPSEWRIATTPLASFLTGTLVMPIIGSGE